MLAFTSVYFFESSLFNGLRSVEIKKTAGHLISSPRLCGEPFLLTCMCFSRTRFWVGYKSSFAEEHTILSGFVKELIARAVVGAGSRSSRVPRPEGSTDLFKPRRSNLPRPDLRASHRNVIGTENFGLVMFKLEVGYFGCVACGEAAGGVAMKSIRRSMLARALMTGVASLAFVTVRPGGVRAEIVTVQGEDGLRARMVSIQATMAYRAATASRCPPTQAARSQSQRP